MKQRDKSIDFMKTILVILMVFAHVVQFFPNTEMGISLSNYVNLTTFSGFMFTFGFVCYKAYIEKGNTQSIKKRLFAGMSKTICAYYISGMAFTIFVSGELSTSSIVDIILFQRIPAYSEFLLSFAFVYLLLYVGRKLIKKMNGFHFAAVAFLSLILTFIDYSIVKIPLVGVFIGTNMFTCFPILQYLSYFLAGTYLASRDKVVDKYLLIISCLGTGIYLYFQSRFGLPGRFPPTAIWIIGGYLFVYFYFIICKKYVRYFEKIDFIFEIGAHSLIYLVISNIVIFILHRYLLDWYFSLNGVWKVGFHFVSFILCIGISSIYVKIYGEVTTSRAVSN